MVEAARAVTTITVVEAEFMRIWRLDAEIPKTLPENEDRSVRRLARSVAVINTRGFCNTQRPPVALRSQS
jgi:hypothetical protein